MKKFLLYLKRFFIFLGVTLGILLVGAYFVGFICINGPSPLAKDLFVLSVRESSAGGFLADIYCSDEEIKEIEDRNSVQKTDDITDTSIVVIEKNDKNNGNQSGDNGESKEDKEEFVDGVRFETVIGSTYRGMMMIVEDPSRVFVGSLDKYGSGRGQTVLEFIDKYDAIGGTNAGGFSDTGGSGTGAIPDGLVISEGELKWGNPGTKYEVIGITKDDILVVGNMTAQKALDMGVRDAVSFGPILVVNGKSTNVGGTGGGLNPRTAIGQRADGAMLLLVIDGRQTSSLGANQRDLINIMLEFGAVNAANLDGGSSSSMYYDGKCYNSSASLVGMRDIPTTILVRRLKNNE